MTEAEKKLVELLARITYVRMLESLGKLPPAQATAKVTG